MLKSLRISQLVAINVGLVLIVALLIGAVGRVAYNISKQQNEVIQTRNQVDRLTQQLQILTIERVDILRRVLETENVRLRLLYQSKQSQYVSAYTELATLLRNPAEAAALRDVLTAEDEFNRVVQETFALYNSGQADAARDLWDSQGLALQNEVTTLSNQWSQVQNQNNQQIIRQARETENLTVNATGLLVVLLLIAGIVASVVITRSITRPIRRLVAETRQIDADLSHRVTPEGPQEIAFLGQSINTMAGRLVEARVSIEEHKNRLENELISASQTQAGFLPPADNLPGNLDIAFGWHPARELGGNFYTCLNLESGQLAVTLCDVVGKGAPAAMTGSLMLGILESNIPHRQQPAQLLTEVNRHLCRRFKGDSVVVSACHLLLNPASGEVTVANAGCMYPLLRQRQQFSEIEVGGLPLGLWPDFDYPAVTVTLNSNDILILSSDGLVEARSEAGEMFGFEQLQHVLNGIPAAASAQQVVDTLMAALWQHQGHADLWDDVTLVVIRRP
ncbi:MAG: hypothetical protein Kow0031_07390 [Anaerolineae bacterium]